MAETEKGIVMPMPVITFKKEYINKLLGFKIEDKMLVDQVAKMGFQVEKIDVDNVVLEITPNRPDMLDAVGFARSLKNFMHKSRKYNYRIDDEKPALQIVVGSGIKKARPFIAGIVALGAKMADDDIANLINFSEKFCETYGRRRKKISIGMHNLDKIKSPLQYDLYRKGSFVPLNTNEEMNFSDVLKNTEKGREYGEILGNGSGGYPALMDDKGAIALIPILNSERTKVDKNTKNMFVDVTGTSEYIVNKTADLFAATLSDLGCDLKRVQVIYSRSRSRFTPELKDNYISMHVSKAEQQLGVIIGYNNVISLANKMGYEGALLGTKIRFKLPVYRIDIINEQDVVEDMAIAYGYDYIQPVKIYSAQQGGAEPETILSRKISETAVGMGFSEMVNSYLSNEKTNFDDMRIDMGKWHVKLKNPKASSVTIMRTWLLPSLLKNLSLSVHDKMPQDLFEIDHAFYIEDNKPVEALHLGVVSADSKANFNTIKSAFDRLNELYDFGYTLEKFVHKSFIEGRCARIFSKKKFAGYIGELHPEVLNNFGIEEPTVALELELSRR